jgi:AraC-like DNA-binding protein
MRYYTIPPSPSLSAWVRFFWVLESESAYCHRSMAEAGVEMVFHYKGRFDEISHTGQLQPSFSSGLHGPSQHIRRFSTGQAFGIFGVYLYPFTIPCLFSLPTNELSDQVPDLASVLGSPGHELEENMMLAAGNEQRVAIISCYLEKKLAALQQHPRPVLEVIRRIIHTGSKTTVDELARESFLSTRQFERVFNRYAGFSPKLYTRILRFQQAAQHYGHNNRNLTDIAYDCGYYDQSHFIHDFKQFSGYHPKQYFQGPAEGVEWKDATN